MMLKRLLGGLLAAALFSGIDTAQAACTVTNSFTAGTTAFANQVNQNFNDIINCALPASGGTLTNGTLSGATTLPGSGVITGTGKVGVGTTNPGRQLTIDNAGNEYASFASGGTERYLLGLENPSTPSIRNFVIYDSTNGVYRIVINNSGNVGIGTTTPANTLQLGSVGATGYAGNAVAMGDGTNAMALKPGATGFLTTSGNLVLGGGSNITNQLFLSSSGSVGIGTTTPTNTLQFGSVGATGYTGNAVAMGDGTNAMALTPGATGFLTASGNLVLGGGSNITNQLFLAPGGNVGVGTTSPSLGRLQVAASAGQHGVYGYTADSGSGYYGVVGIAGAGSYYGALGRADGYAFVGVGTVWATGNGFFNQSDARLKQDIHDLSSTLDTIMKLRPVSYQWKQGSEAFKSTNSTRQYGLIAQEVQKVIPEIVILNKNPPVSPTSGANAKESLDAKMGESYGLEYTKIIPFLIGAIQEQQAEITELRVTMRQLRSANDNLRYRTQEIRNGAGGSNRERHAAR